MILKDNFKSGYNYLKDKGYDEEYCNICKTLLY